MNVHEELLSWVSAGLEEPRSRCNHYIDFCFCVWAIHAFFQYLLVLSTKHLLTFSCSQFSVVLFFITGSIVGRIYNSPTYVDGDVVWTSPITKGVVKENQEVATESGSKYYLSSEPLEEANKHADIAKATSPSAPQKTATMRVTPESLAAALKDISGAVNELELSLGQLSGDDAKPSSKKSGAQK